MSISVLPWDMYQSDDTRRGFGSVHWGLTPQQQPGSYQGGEMMMMKSVFWWRKPEYPEETTYLRQVTDGEIDEINAWNCLIQSVCLSYINRIYVINSLIEVALEKNPREQNALIRCTSMNLNIFHIASQLSVWPKGCIGK